MIRYRNLSGNSGVVSYEIGADFIIVMFEGGGVYLYDYVKPGQASVDQMKVMATRGKGLNSFVNTRVKYRYAKQLK